MENLQQESKNAFPVSHSKARSEEQHEWEKEQLFKENSVSNPVGQPAAGLVKGEKS